MGVGLQGLQGYNSRVITPELLGLSTQSNLGLLTWSYRGYNSRVITPGITGDTGFSTHSLGVQARGYWGYGCECFSAHSLEVQARGYWGYGRGNTGNTGVTGVMGINASVHTACIPCIHP